MRIVYNLIKPDSGDVDMRFYDQSKDEYVEMGSEPDLLNNFFINIVHKLGIEESVVEVENVYNDNDETFCFLNDINKSSCVNGINSMICKKAMLSIPNLICHLFSTSLRTGIIPSEWSYGYT